MNNIHVLSDHIICYGLIGGGGCLFRVYDPTREFLNYMETLPLLMKAANYDLCSALMAIEQ